MKRSRGGRETVTGARRLAVQALYQWQIAAPELAQLLDGFPGRWGDGPLDQEYFRRLVEGCIGRYEQLCRRLVPLLDRPVAELDPVEYAILLIGLYELAHCPEVPWRVVINEAVESARTFGNSESTRYVNGVLDRAARELRDTGAAPGPAVPAVSGAAPPPRPVDELG